MSVITQKSCLPVDVTMQNATKNIFNQLFN